MFIIKSILLFIYRLVYIQKISVLNVKRLFINSFKKSNDKDLIRSEMRHIAHMLEKSLENKSNKDISIEKNEKCYHRLGFLISIWKQEYKVLPKDIKWTQKIYNEYTNHRETGWYCILLDKIESKLRGIKEIENNQGGLCKVAEIDLLQLMKGRRSIRSWKPDRITNEEINLLIEAAASAPNSCNRQTNRFIVIQKRKTIGDISRTIKGGRSFFYKAPLRIIVLNDLRSYQFPDELHTPFQDAAAAIENMLLMAYRIGLGACWGSYTSNTLLILNEKKINKMLKIPNYFSISGVVAIGKPNMRVCFIPRPNIEEITNYEVYSG